MTPHSNAHGASALALLVLLGCQGPRAAAPPAELHATSRAEDVDPPFSPAPLLGSPHAALGVPRSTGPRDELLFDRGVFVGSYARDHLGPNWIAWRVVASDLGDAPRASSFRADRALPGIDPVLPDAFAGAGWDRGHLCPSEDRTATREANRATFVMSNVLPQEPAMNRGSWARLEAHTRDLASNGQTVHVVAGAVWGERGGSIGRVDIPEQLFKVIVASQATAAKDLTEEAIVIAVLVRNDATVKGLPWTTHQTTVDVVEAAIGYDLLSAIPDPLERVLEARMQE